MRGEATVVVLTKPPEPGRVKTRLIPALGPRGAAALHAAMVEQTLCIVGQTGLKAEIVLDAPSDHPYAKELRERGWAVRPQSKGDLGQRIRSALCGTGRRIALGTDAPTIDPEWLCTAADRAEAVVVGPAMDGGYWTIGINASCDALFRDIPWSSPDVLDITMERARTAGLSVFTLPPCYDIDAPTDLKRLATDPRCPPALLPYLESPCLP